MYAHSFWGGFTLWTLLGGVRKALKCSHTNTHVRTNVDTYRLNANQASGLLWVGSFQKCKILLELRNSQICMNVCVFSLSEIHLKQKCKI